MAKRQPKKKLIRDRYIETIPRDEWYFADKKEHIRLLKRKLFEEIDELKASDFTDAEEYADVLEVLMCLSHFLNIDWNDVQHTRVAKLNSKGKFLDGVVLRLDAKENKN
jgi:predicted house-cleaning noncanonical NTP pyrophosphatase (MazG superfamily)